MKNVNFKIETYFPKETGVLKNQVAVIHSEVVISHLDKLTVKPSEKSRLIEEITKGK